MFDRVAFLNSFERDNNHPFVSPRDAASLLIVDTQQEPYRFLMGKRHSKIEFMPDVYVFPGGAIQSDDFDAVGGSTLNDMGSQLLAQDVENNGKGDFSSALGVAALRETFEETGYMINDINSLSVTDDHPYLNIDLGEPLTRLVFLSRAITPPGRPKRFDTRFFIAPRSLFLDEQAEADGELLDIKWVTYDEALSLKIHLMTRVIIEDLNDYMIANNCFDQPQKCAFYSYNGESFQITYLDMQSHT